MSDHADVIRETIREAREGAILTAEEVRVGLAALDALVAERDEWKHKADSWRANEADTLDRLVAAEAERDEARTICDDAVNHLRVRAETAEAEVARLREALGVIADYYEAVYAPGDQAYQAAIVARAALAAPTKEGT